jgi:beta-glucanase (GH16 family)
MSTRTDLLKWMVLIFVGALVVLSDRSARAEDPAVPPAAVPIANGVPSPNTTPAPAAVPVMVPGTVVVNSVSNARPLVRRESIGEYTLAWSDEFNGEKLDTTLWDCRTDTKYWSTSSDKNVTVSGGFLHLALKKEKMGKSDYSGGGVVSKIGHRYGFYEVSMKLQAGKGWHTSVELTGYKAEITGGRQQIDLCENDSIDPKLFLVNLHGWKPIHRIFDTKRVKEADLSQDFHVFGCEFTPQKVRYFFDGEPIASFDASKMVHDDQSIYIYCYSAPLAKTMHVEDDKLPAEVQVDWVRFYEKAK